MDSIVIEEVDHNKEHEEEHPTPPFKRSIKQ